MWEGINDVKWKFLDCQMLSVILLTLSKDIGDNVTMEETTTDMIKVLSYVYDQLLNAKYI